MTSNVKDREKDDFLAYPSVSPSSIPLMFEMEFNAPALLRRMVTVEPPLPYALADHNEYSNTLKNSFLK